MEKKKIVILGAGFAGLKLARKLNNNLNFSVTLIDRYNYHQFQPLFYQAATASINASDISFPIRKVFQNSKNVRVRLAEVNKIDQEKNTVETNIGNYQYDYLVIAMGCTTNFFGNKQIEENSFTMKSTNEALTIKNRLLTNFESVYSAKPEELEEIMNIVIVGGGPTGVELSGAIAQMKKFTLPKDYPDVNFSKLNIYLVEGSPNLLGPMSDLAHKKSEEYLIKLGVDVWKNAKVTNYEQNVLSFEDGRTIKTRNLIWAAGVMGNITEGVVNKDELQRGNRYKVDRTSKVIGTENIYAIGDVSYMETPKYTKGHPQLARVAGDQAALLAKNLNKIVKGASDDELTLFEYKDPGSMATVGKHKAVVDLPKFSFSGRFAWFVWMFLHLMLILTVKNKLSIFLNWAYTYFTNDSSLRIIERTTKKDFIFNQKSITSAFEEHN